VEGLGCKYMPEEDHQWFADHIRDNYLSQIDPAEKETFVKCHNTSAALKSVVKTYFRYKPLTDSAFVKSLYNEIREACDRFSCVVVFGHSFGGAIINRVAEEVQLNPIEGNAHLSFVGLGSIYVAPVEKVQSVDIVNYVSIGDHALKANKLYKMPPYSELTEYASIPEFIYFQYTTERLIDNKKVIPICLYSNEPNEPLCRQKVLGVLGRPGHISLLRTDEHLAYDNVLKALLYLNIKNIQSGVFYGDVNKIVPPETTRLSLTSATRLVQQEFAMQDPYNSIFSPDIPRSTISRKKSSIESSKKSSKGSKGRGKRKGTRKRI
jgi:hypothetical protein